MVKLGESVMKFGLRIYLGMQICRLIATQDGGGSPLRSMIDSWKDSMSGGGIDVPAWDGKTGRAIA